VNEDAKPRKTLRVITSPGLRGIVKKRITESNITVIATTIKNAADELAVLLMKKKSPMKNQIILCPRAGDGKKSVQRALGERGRHTTT
jgi:hypothetical protein